MNDTEAMNEIAEILRVPEWSPECLDYIAEVVRATGRDFSTPEGDE
jgi:hypothetical protein